jgi:hypothetical protein
MPGDWSRGYFSLFFVLDYLKNIAWLAVKGLTEPFNDFKTYWLALGKL